VLAKDDNIFLVHRLDSLMSMQMQIKPSTFSPSWLLLLVPRTGLSADVKQVVELIMCRLEQVSRPVSLKITLVVLLQVLGMSICHSCGTSINGVVHLPPIYWS
jgi:hypothetical protein